MNIADLSPDTHYWAIIDGEAAVVLFNGKFFLVAGDWDGPVDVDRIVCPIDMPKELIGTKLYYGTADANGKVEAR